MRPRIWFRNYYSLSSYHDVRGACLEHSRGGCGGEVDSLHQHRVVLEGVEVHQSRRRLSGAAPADHEHRMPLFLHCEARLTRGRRTASGKAVWR